MYDPVVISLLEKNVRDLQEQLRNAYVKIKQLNDENYKLRRALGVKKDNGKSLANGSIVTGKQKIYMVILLRHMK